MNKQIQSSQKKAIELTSLVGDFLVDPRHSEIYQKLKQKGSKEDLSMMSQLIHGREDIRKTTQEHIQETLQETHEEKGDAFEALLNQDISGKEIDTIRKLYADPKVRNIYFEEYEKRREGFDMLKRGYKQLPKSQKIDESITKAKDKVLDIRIVAFSKSKQLSPHEISYIKKIQEGIEGKEEEKKALLQKRELATAYRHKQIKTYKKQLDTEGFVITPSRQKIIDEIIEKVLLGQNVLLTGPTGTGKTVLAVQAVKTIAAKLHIGLETIQGKSLAQELQNNPGAYQLLDEFVIVLSGHAGITPSEFIAKMGLKGDDKGGTETYTQLGKVLKAFVDGNIPIIDEIDLIPNDVLMRIKHLFTLKTGKTYSPQEDGNQKHKLLTTTVIATANIKSAKHQDRQDLDPAIVRLLPGIEVKYLPEEETYDLALINIIEKNGFAYDIGVESLSDKNGVLYLLIQALKDIEDNYLGKGEGMTISNKANMYLQKAILELGSFIGLFKGFKESGKEFSDFIKNKIIKFISNGAYPKNDRLLLINMFSGKGLITKEDIPALLERMSDISQGDLQQNILIEKYIFTQDKIHFVDPYELANCDPYEKRNLKNLELDDKKSVIRDKIKNLSAYILTIPNDSAEQFLEVLDKVLERYEQDHNYEINNEEIDQILGGLYELGLPEKIVECGTLGEFRNERIQIIKIFDGKEGKKIFKNSEKPMEKNESKEKIKKSLEFEKNTFKIDSTGWKEITKGGRKVKINDGGDVTEYVDGDQKGEQIFITYDVFIRELCKAKNCNQEEAEKKYLMTRDELKEKMKDKPDGSEAYKNFYNKEVKDHLAGYWIPNFKKFGNVGDRSCVWLVDGNDAGFGSNRWNGTNSNRNYGFSGRLLKN